MAVNKLKRLTSRKIENKYLFILSPPYCGSTLLNELIDTSPNVSVNNPFSTREGQVIPTVKRMMYDHIRRWDATFDFDWEFIKNEWDKYWDITKPVLLEKSPPNLIRAGSINNTFENAYFVIFYRNPYAQCEGLIRRNESTPKAAARHALKCLEYQRKNQESSLKSISFSYEELASNPEKIKNRLQEFIPELNGIDSKKEFAAHNFKKKKMKIHNLNEEKIGKLSQIQLDEINEVFVSKVELLNYFNYSLRN